MQTDLQRFIEETPLIDTHEHLRKEREWVEDGPDILQDLFGNYVPADLVAAGATPEAMKRLMDASDGDLAARFSGIGNAWDAVQLTGYGEAVSILAHEVYEMADFSVPELERAQKKLLTWRQPGGRLDLLRNRANLDHVQTDDFCWPCLPDEADRDFFLYDLSWAGFCNGQIDATALSAETEIEVNSLNSLRQAMRGLFERYGQSAIAVKAQHAYNRTLSWQERTDSDAEKVLQKTLAGTELTTDDHLLLGDWCWARGVELAIEYNLPFKIHTGYYAGNDRMPVDRIKSGQLCPLLARYLDCRFVLMHIAYPYSGEVLALAKHYRNVWVDLCWAWSIDPFSSADFVRRFIHTAPVNKLFAFGGDTGWPTSSTAYSIQARRWLNRALQAEVNDGLLSETQAIGVAERLMISNQQNCFDIQGTRQALAESDN
ncbi:MAG: hypothetical protein ACI906_002080 [Candidatus Latescibacterota bacterium]|jgi:hypothetical protein